MNIHYGGGIVTVLVYGATGRTGRQIAGELARSGLVPVLAGRDEVRLRHVAEEMTAEYRVADLDHLPQVLTPDVEVVVNAAGPVSATVVPVARAAAAAGAHYVDLANELAAVQSLVALAPLFERAGRSAVPAAGFGTVATDALARLLTEAVPQTVRLDLGMQVDGDGRSPGAARSAALVLAAGGARLVDGRVERTRLGARAVRHPDLPGASIVPLGLADLVVTPITTGVENVSAGIVVPMPPMAARAVLPVLARGARWLSRSRQPVGRGEHTSRAWARAWRPDGTSEWAHLSAGEGYDFSARAAAATVAGLLRGDARPGVVTAVGQFGVSLAEHAGGRIRSSLGESRVPAE
jgi:short subunit dehydrogenase-like uncharacterized protein